MLHGYVDREVADRRAFAVLERGVDGEQPTEGIVGDKRFDLLTCDERGDVAFKGLVELDDLSGIGARCVFGIGVEDDMAAVFLDLIDVDVLNSVKRVADLLELLFRFEVAGS